MAILFELTQEWDEWVSTRPPVIQEMCKKYPPNKLYRIKQTGHRVTLYSYSEDGTVTVDVTGKYNFVMFDRHVFGVVSKDLEECELPKENEMLGTVLTEDSDIDAFCQQWREKEKLFLRNDETL